MSSVMANGWGQQEEETPGSPLMAEHPLSLAPGSDDDSGWDDQQNQEGSANTATGQGDDLASYFESVAQEQHFHQAFSSESPLVDEFFPGGEYFVDLAPSLEQAARDCWNYLNGTFGPSEASNSDAAWITDDGSFGDEVHSALPTLPPTSSLPSTPPPSTPPLPPSPPDEDATEMALTRPLRAPPDSSDPQTSEPAAGPSTSGTQPAEAGAAATSASPPDNDVLHGPFGQPRTFSEGLPPVELDILRGWPDCDLRTLVLRLQLAMATLQRENAQLESENAQLKKSNEQLQLETERLSACNDMYHAELVQLRERVTRREAALRDLYARFYRIRDHRMLADSLRAEMAGCHDLILEIVNMPHVKD